MVSRLNQGQAMKHIVDTFLPGSPQQMFWTWVTENAHNLREATAKLGVTVEDGPGFFARLEDAVTAKLVERAKGGA